MKYTSEETERLLSKVEAMAERQSEFSSDEQELMRQMIKAWRGWVALKGGFKWFVTSMALLAAAVHSWDVLTKAIRNWISQ